jgi:hypothetical protein
VPKPSKKDKGNSKKKEVPIEISFIEPLTSNTSTSNNKI